MKSGRSVLIGVFALALVGLLAYGSTNGIALLDRSDSCTVRAGPGACVEFCPQAAVCPGCPGCPEFVDEDGDGRCDKAAEGGGRCYAKCSKTSAKACASSASRACETANRPSCPLKKLCPRAAAN